MLFPVAVPSGVDGRKKALSWPRFLAGLIDIPLALRAQPIPKTQGLRMAFNAPRQTGPPVKNSRART